MKQTLLEKAKALPQRKLTGSQIGPEELELCVAWAKGEISLGQLKGACGLRTSGTEAYSFISKAFRVYVRNGHNK